MTYQPIGDYGIIGDLHTAVLVGRNGSIDWCCAPRFDSPSVFAAILDDGRGGRWSIAPLGKWTSEQRYLPATNILETAFHADGGGVIQVTDFMPVGPARQGRSEIHRRVHCPRGAVTLASVFEPRFDYATREAIFTRRASGLLATDHEDDVATLAWTGDVEWRHEPGRAIGRVSVREGETVWFVMRFDDDEVHHIDAYESQNKLDATARWWDAWSSRMCYDGPYRLEVQRSALALKLCCYEPTGAIVAAPTMSLPEEAGGSRNWDYRYTWLRDSSFVLHALNVLGYNDEANAFMRFLKRVCRRKDGRHLQIMFAVDGQRDIAERHLEHLEGYRGARPVLAGNGAAGQFQLDVYGEVLDTAAIWARHHQMTEGLWKVVRDLADWTAAQWRQPDWSIWEARQEPKHYVFSKVMAWVALDRATRLAERLKLPGDVARWRREADELHAEVQRRGWDPVRETFVQAYDEPQVDAALLVIPKVRFLPRSDPRVRSTLAAIRRELASACEDLIYRYRAADGLTGGEGAFVACSFWMVQNLAMVGEFAEAERLFRNLLRRANHVGLLAEEIDPATGEQLGNFPLALSHAAAINTAYILEHLRGDAAPHGTAHSKPTAMESWPLA
ncbi:MAG TPA: glycoside hydrolase family 15 protein [Gemmatimonadales bacterium]|nr:glycoside hydrolase family 15 protein [Gemmatimonadales bacterium]